MEKDFIKQNIEKLDVETLPYFVNEVFLELGNNPDDSIYTKEMFKDCYNNYFFSELVTDNIIDNILLGNANLNDDYFYFDGYLHLQSKNYSDVVNDFLFDIDNNQYDNEKVKEILENYL